MLEDCIFKNVPACDHEHPTNLDTYISGSIHTSHHAFMYMHTHVCTCMHTGTGVSTRNCTHSAIIPTRVCTHTHDHIHAYMHTKAQSCPRVYTHTGKAHVNISANIGCTCVCTCPYVHVLIHESVVAESVLEVGRLKHSLDELMS